MSQLLLFADPRPLVERLGADFFRRAPESPGVYLMRDRANTVLYVGKARNLKKRLASYRVANPDRLRRRHLRLLRAVDHIELRPCSSEESALATETALLRTLRPRFNRAGTWPTTPRFIAWRTGGHVLELAVTECAPLSWKYFGPLGGAAIPLRAALVRLMYYSLFAEAGVAGLPVGWFNGCFSESCKFPAKHQRQCELEQAAEYLEKLFGGDAEPLFEWVLSRTIGWAHPFEVAIRDADLQILREFIQHASSHGIAENCPAKPEAVEP
jgi:predicted GIY-YIG superfamily endonuclease